MLQKKWFKTTMVIVTSIFVLYMVGICISVRFFHSTNPIRSAIGVIQVVCTDTNYAKIQEKPEKYLFKTSTLMSTGFDSFVKNELEPKGYKEDPSQQLGSVFHFENGEQIALVTIHGNKYYMRCTVEYFTQL